MEENIKEAGNKLSKVTLEDVNRGSVSHNELTEDEQDIFAALITNAKQLTTEGKIKDALDLYKQALKMYYNEKLARKIGKMEEYLKETGHSEQVRNTPIQKSRTAVAATPRQEISEDDQVIYKQMLSSARQLVEEGKIKDALELNREALKICYDEKLAKKIARMELYLKQSGEDVGTKTSKEEVQKQSMVDHQGQDTPKKINVSEEDQEIFNQMVQTANRYTEEGRIKDALELYKEAVKIKNNEKLSRKIAKMEAYLKQKIVTNTNENTDDEKQEPVSVEIPNEDDSSKTHKKRLVSQTETFNQLIQTAKQFTDEGRIKDALNLYRQALNIYSSEKLATKIAKMEAYLKENDGNQAEDDNREPVSIERSNEDVSSETSMKRIVSQKDQEAFNLLIQNAKQFTDEGRIKDALKLYRKALNINSSEKLAKKIAKMEAYLNENDGDHTEEEDKVISEPMQSKVSGTKTLKTPVKSEVLDDQERFNRLVNQAKQLISEGKVREALEMNKKALKIHHSDKLVKKIEKMEQYLKEHGDEEDGENEEDENGMVHLGNGYFMYRELFQKLYDHQKEAVLWMWGLHKKGKGGILGDDMGLGKTIQIISFLSGLFDMDKVSAILIVMPVSLIVNWEKEFQKWAPGIRVTAYHGNSKKEKERALTKVQKRGGVMLTSYGLVVTSWEVLGKQDGREFVWDYVILDEGHKIKNPTKTTKGVHAIPARNRIILTGTPIQNNLKELWALFDFVHQGSLLGTARTFKMEYENPITRARERDATVGERKLGQEMAESLKKIIAPYFLRRTKAEVTETKGGIKTEKDDESCGNYRYQYRMPSLTRKNDLILWVFLTQTQQKIYDDFLSLDSVKELLMTKKSPLVALTVLKKITDHPRLLSTRAVAQLGIDDHGLDEDQLESEEAYQSAVNQIKNVDDQTLINESGKLIVLVELLDKLKEEGHRTLVFSQSRKLLDIIDKVITGRGHKVMRLDGTVTHLSERDQRMKKFQTDDRYSVFLLTTQVGGVGLTLTAADRVVIYDPSWNPATDAQAVDRAFRIGQEKNVVIYRMITCGTVEEKIYRRQIFKDSITRQTTGNTKNPYRYFTKQELKELFQLDNPRVSSTQQQLEQMHSGYRKTDESLDAHIAFLYSLDIFGISDHDLMFGQVKDNMDDIDEEYKDEDSHLNGNDYIQARVQKAQELLKMESNLSQPMSHYPSTDGQSTRQRGPYEWNMPSGTRQPDGGPDNVVDMTTEEDPDTDMVDLTETPPKTREISPHHSPMLTTHIKQESPQQPDHIATENYYTGIKSEPQSPNITSETSLSFKNTDIQADSRKRASLSNNDHVDEGKVKDFIVKIEQNDSIVQETEESDAVIVESDDENNIDMKNNESVIMENDENENCEDEGKVSDVNSDDVMMITPLKKHLMEFTESPMKIDSDEGTSPQRSPLKSIENVTKGIGSAVKLLGSQISSTLSSIVNMVTPERQKTPAKSRRKSVCESPWLAKTPRSGTKNVINEEMLISPDGCRPLLTMGKKLNIPLTSQAITEARMNSTIMSAFGNSPNPQRNNSVGSSRSSHSDLGETFVDESPSPKKRSDDNLVQDSPFNSNEMSRADETASVVLESTQNTPAVFKTSVINDSDDSTPKRPRSSLAKVEESASENESIHEEDSPIAKNKRKARKAVIVSSDEEEDIENINDSLENCDSGSESAQTSPKESKRNLICEESDSDTDVDYRHKNSNYKRNSRKNRFIDDECMSDEDEDDEDSEEESRGKRKPKAKSKKNNFIDDESMSGNEDEDESFVDDDDHDEDSFIDDNEDEESVDESEESEEEEESDFDSLSEDLKMQFSNYVKAGRSLYKKGNYHESLVNILQALEIFPHNEVQALAIKVNKKIEEL